MVTDFSAPVSIFHKIKCHRNITKTVKTMEPARMEGEFARRVFTSYKEVFDVKEFSSVTGYHC